MQQFLGYASGILIVLSCIPYIRDILLGKTKPERMTWFIWTILLSIALVAQIAEGGTWSVIATLVDLLGVAVIFLLSFKYGMGGATKLDIAALFGTIVGLALWYITNEPVVAILVMIFIDFLAGMLTVVKTYKQPETETFVAYVICGTGGLLGAISVGRMDFPLIIFPLWICVMNYAIAATIVLGKRNLLRKTM